MAHDGHHRSTTGSLGVGLSIFQVFYQRILNRVFAHQLDLVTELFHDQLCRITVNGLIHRCHNTQIKEGFDNRSALYRHLLCQV